MSKKLSKADALAAFRSAGMRGDRRAYIELFMANDVSADSAEKAFQAGRELARFIAGRGGDAVNYLN